jgi:hypothetical protein
MIKATGKLDDRPTLFIGLSFGNLDRFRAAPGSTYIKISADQVGTSHDIIIFSGPTEDEMARLLAQGMDYVVVDNRSKNNGQT